MLMVPSARDLPSHLRGPFLAMCAFGNSTGLPLVIFSLIGESFITPAARQLYGDRIDPVGILPAYLVFYPLLQWTVGSQLVGLRPPAANLRATVAQSSSRRAEVPLAPVEGRKQVREPLAALPTSESDDTDPPSEPSSYEIGVSVVMAHASSLISASK
jgi:hypothetical protein